MCRSISRITQDMFITNEKEVGRYLTVLTITSNDVRFRTYTFYTKSEPTQKQMDEWIKTNIKEYRYGESYTINLNDLGEFDEL